jgi:diacylglycerol kinase family enzyme
VSGRYGALRAVPTLTGMSVSSDARRRRAAAIAAISLAAVVLALIAVSIVQDLGRLVADAALLLVAVYAAWYAATRTGWRRSLGAAVCAAAVIGALALALLRDPAQLSLALVRILLLVVAVVLARFALGRDVRTLKGQPTAGSAVPRAVRPVLLVNPRSGGGKAERFRLVDACRERGIEAVVLAPGDDLRGLALDAIERGADVIGMAGGDGSQALVASVAATHDVAIVVVPAGTRNHLAADVGLDRDDVIGALDAFDEAVERRIDLAEVNGRVFVNNVSLGLYASIVRSPAYRDAKVDTTLSTLPKVLGPGSPPYDLSFVGPDGTPHERAHVIQVSNNPYRSSALSLASRPRLDTHLLGVIAIEIDDDRSALRFLSAVAAGRPDRYPGFLSWASPTFVVGSATPVDVGLDGESESIEPPLSFSIRREPLRVRLPLHAIGESPAGRTMDARSAAGALWAMARGRPIARSSG